MAKTKNIVLEYQESYQKTLEILKNNEDVLASFVFGSIITGDLWEKSDIDIFVVVKSWDGNMTNIYSSFTKTQVHFKVLSKDEFLNLKSFNIKGSLMHRLFSSSKMVFCKDDQIKNKYDEAKYYSDIDRKKWTLNYLGKLIKALDSTEKSLKNGNYTSSFYQVIQAMDYYAMVYINSRGYMVSKDNINIASNLDSTFESEFKKLLGSAEVRKKVDRCVKYLKMKIDETISETSELIFSILRENNGGISSRELKEMDCFKDYDINMESILDTLFEKNIIKKDYKKIETSNNNLLIMENVYSL